MEDKKSSRPRILDTENQKSRLKTYKYHVIVDGKRICICRACFLKIFAETDNFIMTVALKKDYNWRYAVG